MASGRGRKAISTEVKAKAIERVKAGERRVDVAKTLGVSLPTINNWMAQSKAPKISRSGKLGRSASELELLKLENEYLKKKIAVLEGAGSG